MKVDQKVIARLKLSTDPDVQKMVEFFEFVQDSEVYESYVTLKMYQRKWNKELNEKHVDLINTGKNADVHDKAVDRARSYFKEMLETLKSLQAMKAMMMNEDLEKIKEDKRLKDSTDIAFA